MRNCPVLRHVIIPVLCLELVLATPRVGLGAPQVARTCLARSKTSLEKKTELLVQLGSLFKSKGVPRVPSQLSVPVFNLFDVNPRDYLDAVGKSSIEVIFFQRHLVIRVGDVYVDMSRQDAIRIRELKDYTDKKVVAVGVAFPATEAQIRRLKAKFESLQRQGSKHNYLLNNCSQGLCRGMEKAELPVPASAFQKLIPELTAEFYSRHDDAAYGTVYAWQPNMTPELALANSGKALALKSAAIAGLVTAVLAGVGVAGAVALNSSSSSGSSGSAGSEEKRPDPDVR